MKISNQDLIEAIWINQLKRLPEGVMHRYMGGGVGLCDTTEFWMHASMSEHIMSRVRITDAIGKKQLLARLRAFHDDGLIHSDYDKLLTFHVRCECSELSFRYARDFWLKKGVPEGATDGRRNSTKDIDWTLYIAELQADLIRSFGQQYPRLMPDQWGSDSTSPVSL